MALAAVSVLSQLTRYIHIQDHVPFTSKYQANFLTQMWRTLIGFGAVPACIALYYRLTIPETPRYTFDVARDVEKANDDVEAYMAGKASNDSVDEVARAKGRIAGEETMVIPKASFKDFIKYYTTWKNGKVLLGTAGSWFMLDV